jgi:D-sedoheptulose 7-phosphate isomerase
MNIHLAKLFSKYPELKVCKENIERAYEMLVNAFRSEGKLLIAGNGGSAADCEHIVGELMKGFESKRPLPEEWREKLKKVDGDGELADRLQGAFPAISLVSQTAFITAFSNDVDPDLVFAQQVLGYGKSGDVFLGISTSGNSRNVVNAAKVAKAMGLGTIALTGKVGGKLKSICDVTIAVPYESTPDVQERHLPIYHTICLMLEEEFFGHERVGRL